MDYLGVSGRGPEPDRRAGPVPAGGAQGKATGLTFGRDRLASPGGKGLAYSLKPVPPFRLDLAVWVLRRRPENLIDRWDGRCYRRALALEDGLVEVAVSQTGPPETPQLQVAVEGERVGPGARSAVTAALERLLGLRMDLTEFERFAVHDAHLSPLARRFRGMKPTRFPTVFECLVNAIACQQVTLTVGIRLLGRLAAEFGLEASRGGASVRAFPRPEDVAGRTAEELRSLGFSRQKARALIELAGAVAEGRFDLEALAREPDEVALDRLRRLRGVGRWTAEYVLLRGLGRLHVFPGDDVGARNNLRRWLETPGCLDYEGVHRALARWRPYAGLIYFHLLLDRLAEAGLIAAGSSTHPQPRSRGRRGDSSVRHTGLMSHSKDVRKPMATIRLKRAYEEPSGSDGLRILVERLWPRGLSKERAAVDVWMKDIAPSPELRRWFGHDPAKWEEFQKRYWEELDANPDAVAELRGRTRKGPVTFVYAARDEQHNGALALKEYLRHASPEVRTKEPHG